MDVTAGIVGLLAGAVIAPVADRVATNSPQHRPVYRSVPRSPRLPLVLAGCALFGAACGLAFGLTLEAAIGALFCWILVIVTRTDLEHRLIPDVVVLPGTAALLALRTIDDPSVEWIASALASGLVLFLVVLAYPRGMGMGDVKLSLLLGAVLGVAVIPAFFIGFFAAFVPAAVLMARHGRDAVKQAIPLGPFLALGGVIALFWGDWSLDWYRNLAVS